MADDLSSEFDDSEVINKKRIRLDLSVKIHDEKPTTSDKSESNIQWNKEDKQQKYLVVDAYTRHKMLINEYMLTHSGATNKLQRDRSRDKTDRDVIRANSKFLWSEDEEPSTWEAKLAKKYYDKLFKEYCVTDLSRYKENKIALRWRTQQEVVDGKGQFICAEKKCNERQCLSTWEVNFAYMEENVKKNALVKLKVTRNWLKKLLKRNLPANMISQLATKLYKMIPNQEYLISVVRYHPLILKLKKKFGRNQLKLKTKKAEKKNLRIFYKICLFNILLSYCKY